jgi:putative transposase
MKKSRFTESLIVGILKEYEAGKQTKDRCREHGIAAPTFYAWKRKYGGMDTQQLKELKALQEENPRLKHMFADLGLDHRILKTSSKKSFEAL